MKLNQYSEWGQPTRVPHPPWENIETNSVSIVARIRGNTWACMPLDDGCTNARTLFLCISSATIKANQGQELWRLERMHGFAVTRATWCICMCSHSLSWHWNHELERVQATLGDWIARTPPRRRWQILMFLGGTLPKQGDQERRTKTIYKASTQLAWWWWLVWWANRMGLAPIVHCRDIELVDELLNRSRKEYSHQYGSHPIWACSMIKCKWPGTAPFIPGRTR